MSTRGWPLRGPTPRFIPSAKIESRQEEAGPQLRAHGLKGEDVRRVVLTYLDVDHVGGIAHFPNAEFIVHPREHEFAHSFLGRQRQRPQDWPDFDPVLYDFEPEPLGPFPESKAVTEAGDLRLVPLPGHTIGQVGAILQADGSALFFAADHMLCQAWFLEDLAADRLTNIGLAARKRYAETNQRIHRFVQETPTVLLPAHDTEAATRLEAMETVKP